MTSETTLWCNFVIFSLKIGVWSSNLNNVILAEFVHSIVDYANLNLLAYGLSSSHCVQGLIDRP